MPRNMAYCLSVQRITNQVILYRYWNVFIKFEAKPIICLPRNWQVPCHAIKSFIERICETGIGQHRGLWPNRSCPWYRYRYRSLCNSFELKWASQMRGGVCLGSSGMKLKTKWVLGGPQQLFLSKFKSIQWVVCQEMCHIPHQSKLVVYVGMFGDCSNNQGCCKHVSMSVPKVKPFHSRPMMHTSTKC